MMIRSMFFVPGTNDFDIAGRKYDLHTELGGRHRIYGKKRQDY